MKKAIALILSLAMFVGMLTGCASSSTASNAPSSTTASTPAGGNASADTVTIELWLQKTNVVDQFAEMISKFESDNPGIKIELTSVPDPETALVSRIAGNDYPDIITIWPAEKFYRDLMKDGALMDISSQPFMSQVAEGSREIAKYDGKDYALSMTMSAFGILVNNKIFEANQIKAPETWDELIAACEKLKSAGIQPFTFYGKSTEQVGQLGERMVGIINNDITSAISKVGHNEATWNDLPEMRQLADALVELHKYGQVDILGADYEAAFSDMATEKAAMMIYGSWGVQRLLSMNPELDITMIAIPNPTGGKNMIPASIDTALSISESCENKEAALKFLEYMSKTETAQWYADNEKNPPIIKGVQYNVETLKTMQQKLSDGDMFFTPSVYWPAGFRKAWEAPLQALIDPMSTNDVDAFLKSTQDLCVEYFMNE